MVHITDYPCFHEQGYYAPGDTGAPVFDTSVGRIGVSICYDRHYPEYMRALAVAGAEMVVVPQAGAVGEWPEGLYEAELRVAAFQNGYFTALCNRVGGEECLDFAGESFVCGTRRAGRGVGPKGEDQILLADIDLAEAAESHARRLFLRDRRPELYGEWLAKRRRHHTSSGRYFSRASLQKTTRNAVNGIARIIPMMPLSAVPQKKIATMITTG